MRRSLLHVLRVLGYLAAVLVVTVSVMALAKSLLGDWEAGDPRVSVLGNGALTVLGIGITNLLLVRLLGFKRVAGGWPRIKTSTAWFFRGGLLGAGMAGLMLLLTVLFGGGRISFEPGALGPYVRYALPLSGVLLIAALGEEWLFRGYPIAELGRAFGRGWANLAMALLFAAAHLGSSGVNGLVLLNIVLGSLVVGSLRFTSGGIPAAWGFHFAWNGLQVLLGSNLSLEGIEVPGVSFSQSGPVFVSGGVFGPEAGIGATLSTAVVLLVLGTHFRRRGVHELPFPMPRTRNQASIPGTAEGMR